MASKSTSVSQLVSDFVEQLTAAVEQAAIQRVQTIFSSQVSGAAGGGATRRPGRPPGRLAGAPVRKQTLSPARIKSLKLQGQYIAILRRLEGQKRARVKAVAQTKGVAEALKLASTL